MGKQEFLACLREGLSGLPEDDVAERLAFYEEMIDDRMEDGLTEEEAVAGIGPAGRVVAQIIEETPFTRIVRERVRPKRRMRAWEIVLLALGSPVWLSLMIAGAAVVFALYVVIWAVILSLWAAEAAVAVSALACVAAGVFLLCRGSVARGLCLIGAGVALAGVSIFLFFGCLALTRGAAVLTKKIALGIKSLFLRKETVK